MRILHTSDWHIGKKTENIDRLAEQAEVLDEICAIAESETVDLVLVAGDVFDTFIPSADAEQLFYEKIVHLAGKERSVVVISGNHDDATRLCAASPLAGKHNVYFSGSVNKNLITTAGEGKTKLISCGEGFACFEGADGERVYIGMLPYPTEARFHEKSNGEPPAERIVGWMNKCLEGNVDGYPQILVAHLFTLGGLTTEGEREISLGGAKAVDKSRFPACAYTALGHLHKRQVVDSGRNIIYSGSILQYAFDEVNIEKSVTVFDITGGEVQNLHTVPLCRGKRLAKVSAISVESALELLKSYKDFWVELTLKLKSPLKREESDLLYKNHPNVISLKLEIEGSVNAEVKGRKELNDEQLFAECYKRKYGGEPEAELVRLYLSLLGEVEK